MSYCSRSCRRRFTVLNFKSWAFSRICGHCQQQFNGHAQKRLFRNAGISFGDLATFPLIFFRILHAECHSIPRPRFIKCEISAIWRRFPLIFALQVFLLPVYFTYCARFEVDMAIHCRVIAFLLLICCVTLWPWLLTFWLWPALIHGGSRDQHCQKVRRSYAYPFLSYEL